MSTYRYRSHIAWLRPVLPAILILMAVWVGSLLQWGDFLAVSLVIGIILLGEAWLIWHIFGRMARVEVTLGENGISYRGKKGTIEMPFETIRRFRYPSIRYMGGWLKIVSDAGTVRLTVVVKNIGQFVRDLKEALDRCGLSSRYDRAKLFRFYRTAEYSDQSWGRIYENGGNTVALLILAAAAGWLASFGQADETFLPPAGLWMAGAMGWAAVVYLIAECELMRRFARDSDEANFSVPERKPAAERTLFRNAFAIGAIFFAAGAIFVRGFVG